MPDDQPSEDDLDDSDLYLDALGNGIDLPGDRLGATQWRKDIDREPLNVELPSDHTARGEMPPGSTTGGTLSATDDAAAQIRALANSQNVPTQVLTEAFMRLGEFLGEVRAATGDSSQHQQGLLESVQQAQAAVETAIGACTKLLEAARRRAAGGDSGDDPADLERPRPAGSSVARAELA